MAWQEQISVGLMLVASDPSAQLVQVAQTEPVRAIDDDRVRVRNIESAFDDGCGKQHVGFAIDEFRHDVLEFIAVHLSVADHNARMRQQRAELLFHRVDGEHAVVQEENLAAAVQLALDDVRSARGTGSAEWAWH